MCKTDQAVRQVYRTPYRNLSNDLQACIETGNEDEARLVKSKIIEAHDEGLITHEQRAELIQDFFLAGFTAERPKLIDTADLAPQ